MTEQEWQEKYDRARQMFWDMLENQNEVIRKKQHALIEVWSFLNDLKTVDEPVKEIYKVVTNGITAGHDFDNITRTVLVKKSTNK
jgi:hypothetical protein